MKEKYNLPYNTIDYDASDLEKVNKLEEYLESHPEDKFKILMYISNIVVNESEFFDRGLEILKRYENDNSNKYFHKITLSSISSIYFNKKDYKTALEYRMKLIDLYGYEPGFIEGIARCYERLNDEDKAIEWYKKNLDCDSHCKVNAHSVLGSIYLKREEFSEAIYYLSKAVEFEPDSFYNNYSYAIALAKNNQPELALPILIKLNNVKTNDAELAYNTGLMYSATGDELMAAHYYKKAIEIDSGYEAAYSNLGAFYSNYLEDDNKALELYEKAAKLSKNNEFIIFCYFNMVLLYKNLNNEEKGVFYMEKVFKIIKNNIEELKDSKIVKDILSMRNN